MEEEDKDKDEMVGAYVCGQGGEHKGRGRSSVRFAQHPAPSRLLATQIQIQIHIHTLVCQASGTKSPSFLVIS